jgi:hypothetical protein
MNLKINQKDIKTLKLGGLGIIGIIVFLVGLQGYEQWRSARKALATKVGQVELLDVKPSQREGLLKAVPVFEMPVVADKQKFLFRNKIEEQLQTIGINSTPLLEQAGGGKPLVAGYQMLRYKGTGTCSFNQILNLLAVLKENPYLVGIEELRITVQSNTSRGGMSGSRGMSTTGGAAGARGGAAAAGPGVGQRGGGGSAAQTEFEFTVSTLTK